MIEDKQDATSCLNCHVGLTKEAIFCHNCGQKHTDGRISLKEFIQDFIDRVFNVDSRIVKTLTALCVPGKLTIEYFKGKHKSYYHPIRLYLVMSLIFFAILSFQDDSFVEFNLMENTRAFYEKAEKEKYFLLYRAKFDSISHTIINENRHPLVHETIDSLKSKLPASMERDSFEIALLSDDKSYKIDRMEAMTLSHEEVIEKYEIEGFVNRILAKQSLRFFKDEGLFSNQLASNLPLMLLAMMPALALFLKLLYYRKAFYFVEHLVLNFHHHAFAFLLFSIIILMKDYVGEQIIPFAALLVLLFLFFSMKRVYQQSYLKTFAKFTIFNFLYLFSFLIVVMFTFVISFFLF